MVVGWTHPFAPLGVPLVDRDDAGAVMAAWLDHLSHDLAMPARLLLPLIPEHGAFAKALDRVLAGESRRYAAFGHHERALLAPGSRREGYLERAMSAGKRKELRRQRRRLEDVAPVTFTTTRGAPDIEAALKDFLVLEASGWKGLAGTAIVSEPSVKKFRAERGRSARGRGTGADRPAVPQRHRGRRHRDAGEREYRWCWKIAYNEGLARSSPGVQLICDLTESLLAAPGPARVDSCAAAGHPMIDHVWRERLALSDRLIALRPSWLPFALACRIETLRRRAIAKAKAVRDRLRQR